MSPVENKMIQAGIMDIHPEAIFGDDWIEYLARIKKALGKFEKA